MDRAAAPPRMARGAKGPPRQRGVRSPLRADEGLRVAAMYRSWRLLTTQGSSGLVRTVAVDCLSQECPALLEDRMKRFVWLMAPALLSACSAQIRATAPEPVVAVGATVNATPPPVPAPPPPPPPPVVAAEAPAVEVDADPIPHGAPE